MSKDRKPGTIVVEGVATDEEISKASEITGIPEWEFKRALGKQLIRSHAKTLEEARREITLTRSGSEEEFAAQLRYNELMKEEVVKINTTEDMINFIQSSYVSALLDDSVQILALRRIIEILRKK